MPEKVESKPVEASASNDKVLAAVATMPLVGLIMFYAMKDASPIVKHYAKQSNAVLALYIASSIVSVVLGAVTFMLGGIGGCVGFLVGIVAFVAWIILVVKALNEDEKYVLPAIGEYFDKLLK